MLYYILISPSKRMISQWVINVRDDTFSKMGTNMSAIENSGEVFGKTRILAEEYNHKMENKIEVIHGTNDIGNYNWWWYHCKIVKLGILDLSTYLPFLCWYIGFYRTNSLSPASPHTLHTNGSDVPFWEIRESKPCRFEPQSSQTNVFKIDTILVGSVSG